MDAKLFLETYESLPTFKGIKANDTVYKWWDSQGSVIGIKALGFRCGCPNSESDDLGLHKDGRSRRGVPPYLRPVDNSKRRGIKGKSKSQKRKSVRFS